MWSNYCHLAVMEDFNETTPLALTMWSSFGVDDGQDDLTGRNTSEGVSLESELKAGWSSWHRCPCLAAMNGSA